MGRDACSVRNPDLCVCRCASKWVHVRLSGDCSRLKERFGGDGQKKGNGGIKVEESKSLG